MSERKPTPESELLDDLKAASLEAAAQMLSGVSKARKLTDTLRDRYTAGLERRLGLDADCMGSVGDAIFTGAKLQMDQARTLLRFQRWISDTVYDGLQRAAEAPGGEKPAKGRERFKLEGPLGGVATLTLPIRNRGSAAAVVAGHTQVLLRPGTRAYLEWADAGPTPASVAANAEAQVEIPVRLVQAMLAPGNYTGVCVIEQGDDSQRFDLDIVVGPKPE